MLVTLEIDTTRASADSCALYMLLIVNSNNIGFSISAFHYSCANFHYVFFLKRGFHLCIFYFIVEVIDFCIWFASKLYFSHRDFSLVNKRFSILPLRESITCLIYLSHKFKNPLVKSFSQINFGVRLSLVYNKKNASLMQTMNGLN